MHATSWHVFVIYRLINNSCLPSSIFKIFSRPMWGRPSHCSHAQLLFTASEDGKVSQRVCWLWPEVAYVPFGPDDFVDCVTLCTWHCPAFRIGKDRIDLYGLINLVYRLTIRSKAGQCWKEVSPRIWRKPFIIASLLYVIQAVKKIKSIANLLDISEI